MRTRCQVIVTSLMLMMATSSMALSPQEKQSIEVIAVEYPPFTTSTKDSYGISFEVLNQAADHLAYDWTPVFYPPKRALKMIQEGNWCPSFYPATQSKDHQLVELHEEKFSISLVRKRQNTAFRWQELSELEGQSVVLLRTSNSSAFARQFSEAGMKMIFVETIDAGIKMLEHGRADVAMYDSFSFDLLDASKKAELQFAATSIIDMPVRLFVNNKCLDIEKLKLKQVKGKLK